MEGGGTEARVAGVELGGTKCILTLGSGPGAIDEQVEFPTDTPATTLPAIAARLREWRERAPFSAIGIASFGPVGLDPAAPGFGRILNTPKPGWAMAEVVGVLADPLGLPFAFDTDVNGAAFAEMAWGAGIGLDDFAYVTVGTGVGVGLIVGGAPTRGIGHSELGHLRVPRLPGDESATGCSFHPDCVEGLASGPGLKAAIGAAHIGDIAPDHPIWNRVADALAKLCHGLAVAAGPKRIAIGGGVTVKQPHLLPRIEPLMRASLNGYLALPEPPYVVAPTLGAQAGPLGSIRLAQRALAAVDQRSESPGRAT